MSKIKIQAVFERREKKYVLDGRQFQALWAALAATMQQDEYGKHTISSIYYDTEDYSIIRHSLDKPDYKEKLRLRSYGTPNANTIVFLELKKKLAGVTYKRRMSLPLEQAAAYMDFGRLPEQRGQIFEEINYFVQRNQPSAKTILSYDRLALFGKEDPELRITFDERVRWRSCELDLSAGSHGESLLPPEQRLMEIKTLKALPLWLAELLSSLGIYATSFSKYGTVYRDHLLHGEEIRYAG